jgi:XTP/dITP diphosphohydrolase
MKEFERIVVATHNPAKIQRFKEALLKVTDNILTLADLGVTEKADESGATADENAEIKAAFYANLTGKPVFSQDAALYVDFLPLDKQPGVYVRRVNGKELSDDELIAYWEEILAKVPEEKRTGKWHAVYCLATPQGKISTFSIDQPRRFFYPASKIRIPGWPLSSLAGHPMFDRPMSELTKEETSRVHQEMDDALMAKLPEFLRQTRL